MNSYTLSTIFAITVWINIASIQTKCSKLETLKLGGLFSVDHKKSLLISSLEGKKIKEEGEKGRRGEGEE